MCRCTWRRRETKVNTSIASHRCSVCSADNINMLFTILTLTHRIQTNSEEEKKKINY